ncbi:hypothetical protein CHU98_g12218 [Xylaria longipes]|nr:hypothetical protein CHU98_g12218 [Xylaria longipes]
MSRAVSGRGDFTGARRKPWCESYTLSWSAQPTILALDKVTLHEGDLKYSRLGLSENLADLLFAQIDVIIHNGADISHITTYPSVRLENLQSIKELAEMGLPRMIPYLGMFTAASGQDEFGGSSSVIPAESRAKKTT